MASVAAEDFIANTVGSSSGPLGQLSEILGAQAAALRLLISILLGFPLALVYRRYLYGTNPLYQHIYFAVSGLIIGYWNYGWTILHPFGTTVTTYFIITLLQGSFESVIVTLVFNMGYLISGYYVTNTESYDIKWTMPQCVLALRLIGLAFDVYDGTRPENELSVTQKKSVLQQKPNFLEVIAFSFFPGSFLIGPQYGMKRFKDFVKGDLIESQRNSQGRLIPPESLGVAAYRAAIGLFYLSVYQLVIAYVSDQYIMSPEFGRLCFFHRLLLLGLWGRVTLYKYISCWLLAEGVAIAFGLSYNGKNKDGKEQWDGLANVKLITFENATEFNHYIQSFNINTNVWCAEYVYKRLKFLGSRLYSQISVLLFLAIWHGLHSGYYMCFLMEFIIMFFEKEIKSVLQKNVTIQGLYEKSFLFRAVIWSLLKLYTFVFMGYSLIPFVLLSYQRYMAAYKNVNFIGHIFFISLLIATPFLKKQLRPKRSEQREH